MKRIKLNKVCVDDSYKNKSIEYNGNKYPTYILAYLIDYFYSLGGYNSLFQLCRENPNIKIATDIFENIIYGCPLTESFKGKFETEKNGINTIIFNFMNKITPETLKEYKKAELINFLRKGCSLYPNINESSTFIFEELYIKLILKNLVLETKKKKKLELLNEINNILSSIEYNQLINENKNNKSIKPEENNKLLEELNQKYQNRDQYIIEMDYIGFCKNCKNNEVIEELFKGNNINEEILEKFAPTLFLMYKNNFGYLFSESNEEKITSTKKIIFDTLLNTLKITEKENFKAFTKIIKVICLFCEVLTDEDKYFIANSFESK